MDDGHRKRVLIVEDSKVTQMLLEEIIGADPRLEVAATVSTAEEALRILQTTRPDVISLDVRLPGMNGIEATERIMSVQPTPIVVVAASVDSDDLRISLNALLAGALSIVEKPVATTRADYGVIAARLCRQLALMSEVPVIRRRGRHARDAARAPAPARPAAVAQRRTPHGRYSALGLVASTGGPNAVATVLQDLGSGYPLPVLLVQHITPSFVEGFAAWLDGMCPLRVVIARGGELVNPGHVYLSAPERHLELDGQRLRVSDGAPVSGQRPSGNLLLASLARSLGSRALAVLLTGMGDDGAAGLRLVYEQGGYTIAEDESTAVVYGMPAAAVRQGAVSEQLPLPRIGSRLREVCQPQRAL